MMVPLKEYAFSKPWMALSNCTAANQSTMLLSSQLNSVTLAVQPSVKSLSKCQLMLTPQLSPQGKGVGKSRLLSLANSVAISVRLSKGTRRACGGKSSAGSVALHTLPGRVLQPQAQVLQGTTESLKNAENDTQHFGVFFKVELLMLQITCQLATTAVSEDSPSGLGKRLGDTRTGGPQTKLGLWQNCSISTTEGNHS